MLFIKKIICSVLIGVLLVGLAQAYSYRGQSASLALPHNIGKQQEEMTKLLQEKESLKTDGEVLESVLESIDKINGLLGSLKRKRTFYILSTISTLCLTAGTLYLFFSAIILAVIIIYAIIYPISLFYIGFGLAKLYRTCKDIKVTTKKLKPYNEHVKKQRELLTSIREVIGHTGYIDAQIQHIHSQHKETVSHIENQLSKIEYLQELKTDNYIRFRSACSNGKIELVKEWIGLAKELDPQNKKGLLEAMLKAKSDYGDYYGFIVACQKGHVKVIEGLLRAARELDDQHNSHVLEAMLKGDNYFGFRWACHKGHVQVVEELLRASREQDTQNNSQVLEDMLKADDDDYGNYAGFRTASLNGEIKVVDALLRVARELDAQHNSHVLEAMLKAVNYYGFRMACRNKNNAIIDLILINVDDKYITEFLKQYPKYTELVDQNKQHIKQGLQALDLGLRNPIMKMLINEVLRCTHSLQLVQYDAHFLKQLTQAA